MKDDKTLNDWAERLYLFDYWTDYSDDYSVYKHGLEESKKLKEDIKQAAFLTDEKNIILAKVGAMFDSWNKDRSWAENPQIKIIIESMLR